jgi:membrane protein implicated in regulation of membrane protease activity
MDFWTVATQFAWIGWTVLIALFLVIEMLTLDLTFLMLALGGIAGIGGELFGAQLWLQVVIAAAVAVLLLLFLRPPLLRRLRRGEDATPSNVEALLGLAGLVVATVNAASGQVKLVNGDVWTARDDSGASLPPGTAIRVVKIEGATAVVHRQEESAR